MDEFVEECISGKTATEFFETKEVDAVSSTEVIQAPLETPDILIVEDTT
jgi:hypothetical protein